MDKLKDLILGFLTGMAMAEILARIFGLFGPLTMILLYLWIWISGINPFY